MNDKQNGGKVATKKERTLEDEINPYFSIAADKEINGKKEKIDFEIECNLNMKFPLACMSITWRTKEDCLLRALLMKFVSEKVPFKTINYKNGIVQASIGKSGIIIMFPENKFFNILLQIYHCLFNSEVKCEGNYKKLMNDLCECDILVTGRIKTLLKNLNDDSKRKINAFIESIGKLKIKESRKVGKFPGIVHAFKLVAVFREKGKTEYEEFSEKNKYDVAMLLNHTRIPFWFDGSMICTLDGDTLINDLKQVDVRSQFASLKFQSGKNEPRFADFLNVMYARLYNFQPSGSDWKDTIRKLNKLAPLEMTNF